MEEPVVEEKVEEPVKEEVVEEKVDVYAERIQALEESIRSLSELVKDLMAASKEATEKLDSKIEDVKRSTEVDNIEKLRELEQTDSQETESKSFDWVGFIQSRRLK